MKNKNILLFLLLLSLIAITQSVFAQQPGINMEAIAKDRNNNPAKNRHIYVRVDIIPVVASNSPSFSEEHITQTNATGIFQISIGKGTLVGGTYNTISEIPWQSFNHLVRLRVAIAPLISVPNWNYQNEWIDIGTTPFGLVPYAGAALSAEKVASNAAVISLSGGTTGLTPATASTGNVVLGGVLSIANGGTASSVKNFVDLNTAQVVGGIKSFSSHLTANGGLQASNLFSLEGNNTPLKLNNNFGLAGDVLMSSGASETPVWMNLRQAIGIKSKNRSALLLANEEYEISVPGLDTDDGISVSLEVTSSPASIPNYYLIRDVVNNKITVHFTAPYSGFVTWVIVD